MTAYERELRRCQVVLMLRAVIDAGGNQTKAAAAAGVHRNTMSRILRGAGYDVLSLHRLAKTCAEEGERKPALSTDGGAEAEERMTA